MLIKIEEISTDIFIPGDEKSAHFFRYLGKERLTFKDLTELLQETIELQLDVNENPISTKLEKHLNAIIFYSRSAKLWCGNYSTGRPPERFYSRADRKTSSTRTDLIRKMFYKFKKVD